MAERKNMTQQEREYFMRVRGLLIEQEKALTEQRAAIIGQRKALEKLINYSEGMTIHEPSDNETLTSRLPYTA
jgi:hypothetical protein